MISHKVPKYLCIDLCPVIFGTPPAFPTLVQVSIVPNHVALITYAIRPHHVNFSSLTTSATQLGPRRLHNYVTPPSGRSRTPHTSMSRISHVLSGPNFSDHPPSLPMTFQFHMFNALCETSIFKGNPSLGIRYDAPRIFKIE